MSMKNGDASAASPLVLVGDDDAALRRLARVLLARAGCDMLESQDVPTAIRLGLENIDRLGLAILDLEMPGGSGLDAVRALHAVRPSLPVAIMSGYGRESLPQEAQALALISKPFSPEQFVSAVKGLLGPTAPRTIAEAHRAAGPEGRREPRGSDGKS